MFSFSRWLVFFAVVATCYSRRINPLHKRNHLAEYEGDSVDDNTLILAHVVSLPFLMLLQHHLIDLL